MEIPFRFKSQILTSFSSPTPKQQLSWIWFIFYLWMSFVCVSRWFSGKASTFQCRRCSKIPGSGRFPEVGNGSPLQYSCWDNPMNKGDYPWTVHGLASYSPWDHKELAMTEQLSTHAHVSVVCPHIQYCFLCLLFLFCINDFKPNILIFVIFKFNNNSFKMHSSMYIYNLS